MLLTLCSLDPRQIHRGAAVQVLEKEASKLWRRVKRAEKMVVRIFVMKRSWQNRHDEAVEYGEISSESDDDDLDDDEEFDIHDPEEVGARMQFGTNCCAQRTLLGHTCVVTARVGRFPRSRRRLSD